jgi:hypothetical protein
MSRLSLEADLKYLLVFDDPIVHTKNMPHDDEKEVGEVTTKELR